MIVEAIAQIRPNQILIYSKSDKKRTVSDESKANLIQNKKEGERQYSGEINKTAQKKVRKIIENWSYAIENVADKYKKKHNFNRKLTFITLTLSSSQKHSDKQIKRTLLDSFLVKIQRDYRVKNYIWKAELQKCGSIHFHLIVDAYIHWSVIRKIWNQIQEKFGYISDFKEKYGYEDPNSTDVKSIKTAKVVSIYISKYITKKEKYKDTRLIEGRVWGCSDSLKNLKYYEKLVNTTYYEDFKKYYDTDEEFFYILNEIRKMDEDYKQIEINEYTEIHCFKRDALLLYSAWSLEESQKIASFYQNIIELLYN